MNSQNFYKLVHHIFHMFVHKAEIHLPIAPGRAADAILVKYGAYHPIPFQSIFGIGKIDDSELAAIESNISLLSHSHGFGNQILKKLCPKRFILTVFSEIRIEIVNLLLRAPVTFAIGRVN